nr:site-2 protease family protein [Ardenticatena sp.]
MLGNRLRIARLFGIPIYLDGSWLIVFALVTYSLAASYFPNLYPRWSLTTYWVTAFITSLLFFLSVLLHELAHSLVSLVLGLRVRGITLFIFGGIAEIEEEPPRALYEFLVAIVGPLTSMLIGVASLFVGWVVFWWLFPVQTVHAVLRYIGVINVLLAVFNLLPGFPLDGGRIFRSIVWALTGSYRRATQVATTVGEGLAWLFIIGGGILVFRGQVFDGVWLAFIGWFVLSAARGTLQAVETRRALEPVPVQRLMHTTLPVVVPYLTLDVLADTILNTGQRAFLVRDPQQGPIGIVTLSDVQRVPASQRATKRVVDVMTPFEALLTVKPDDSLWRALELMARHDVHQVPVVDDTGAILGVVRRNDILRFLQLQGAMSIDNGGE